MYKKSIKDIRRNTNVLYKKTEYPDMSFIGGEYLIFLVKKVENFVRAIYLITNFLSDSEPLKWRLRTTATELIDKLMSFIRSEVNQTNTRLYKVNFLGCLSELVSLLNVGEEGGVVSEANAELLKREIQSFFPIFNEKIFVMRKDDIENLPIVNNKSAPFRHKPARGRPRLQRHLSVMNNKNISVSPIHGFGKEINVLYKDKGHNKIGTKHKISSVRKDLYIRSERRRERQKTITDILKDKKKLTIRELLSFIKNCGEKTLQRDLYELSDKGVLKKEGEKRWSAYSFVQPLLL
ncbi:MAG: hypothetical protein UX81_C0008G0024 [Parcubacteria group bacterium GW2011_GWA2_47_12]|nr:MAG: hypothetical protein UX81_C0008G0024 [Parcubacteria group bacterium GW2011_GWA2_47_12]